MATSAVLTTSCSCGTYWLQGQLLWLMPRKRQLLGLREAMVGESGLTDDWESLQLSVAAHISQDIQPINLRHHEVLQDTQTHTSAHATSALHKRRALLHMLPAHTPH